ncbi:MAG: ADP-ribosylglycohydrolase family protein, partial [Chloroflexi bacterium]
GAQIFIDGWAMVAPGDPELAADLAKRAASVSHDGEAIYGAQAIAAMKAQAFVEPDLNKLIDTAVRLIPANSVISRMIQDIRDWHSKESDWHKARESLADRYGYHKYGGNCHMVPNHGLIIFSLLYGDDDFQKSLMVVNTSGWDTDCNSGNVGCLLGIKNGLAGLQAGPDFRGPVADRLYLATADGGRAISAAVTETLHLVNAGRRLAGREPLALKHGAQFHFDLPGSVQGFQPEDSIETQGTVTVENVIGHSGSGSRSLALHYVGLAQGRVARVATPTFIPSAEVADYFDRRGYSLYASPRLYPGQTVYARVVADQNNEQAVRCKLYGRPYAANDELGYSSGPEVVLAAGHDCTLEWAIDNPDLSPIACIGLEINGDGGTGGTVYLDYLRWGGTPNVHFDRPDHGGLMWKRAWVNGLDHADRLTQMDFYPEPYRLLQNHGRGLMIQGTREWTDYQASARLTPHMCRAGGIGVRAQGMQRYYAMLVDQETTRLVRTLGNDTVLAETNVGWCFGRPYELTLRIIGNQLVGLINSEPVIEAADPDHTFEGGGIALICEEGRIGCDSVRVR